MTAIDTATNKSIDSKYPARIAKYIGVKEDTVYGWMKLDIKMKSYLDKRTGKNYLIYLDSTTL